MKKGEFLYLSLEDVIQVGLTFADAISIVEGVLTEHGLQHFENPPKPGVHPLEDAFIHAMPGYLPRKKAAGLKWVSGFSSNYKYDLPSIMGLMVLNDVQTGLPLTVMDCSFITAIRTAAASGVAVKYLAKKNAKFIGIVGAGIQGRYHLLSMKEVLDGIQMVRVFDTSEEAVRKFISSMGEMVSFPIESCESAEDAIQGADIIITATGQLDEAVYKEEWISEGALVLPVHTRGWEHQTLHKVDKLIVDDWLQFSQVLGGTDGFYAPLPDLYAELGEVVVGKKPGRENNLERIINFNFGMAIHDVATATEILARAREKGLGTTLTLMERNLPFS